MGDSREYNGGKFPNHGDSGLGLSEFIDTAGVNNQETAPLGTKPEGTAAAAKTVPSLGGATGSPREFDSTGKILAGAALGLLAGWALGGGRRSRSK